MQPGQPASLAANYVQCGRGEASSCLSSCLLPSGLDGSVCVSVCFCAMARAVGVYFYLTAYQTQPSGLAPAPALCRHKVGVGFQ